MITKIETLNYRSLRHINQDVSPFQILFGPNASGKSTFMDVISLISDIISEPNIKSVILNRVRDFRDLLWMRESEWFELAIEVKIPEHLESVYKSLRYAVRIGINPNIAILRENLWLIKQPPFQFESSTLTKIIGDPMTPSRSVRLNTNGLRNVLGKTDKDSTVFNTEDDTETRRLSGSGTMERSVLSYIPDREHYPVTTWFTEYISNHVQKIALDSEKLRQLSLPQDIDVNLAENGSNLPRVVQRLKDQHPTVFQDWLAHIQVALPDIKDITTFDLPVNSERYLIVEYASGLKIPSWTVSDGTLRLLAMTIIAYLPDFEGIYLIEEPENGVHPRILETIYQSLRSIYQGQVFLATHSPIFLNLVELDQLLCFVKQENGETQIIRGDLHPRLEAWSREISLSTLFASGVLE